MLPSKGINRKITWLTIVNGVWLRVIIVVSNIRNV